MSDTALTSMAVEFQKGEGPLPVLVRARYWLQFVLLRLSVAFLLGMGDAMRGATTRLAGRLAWWLDARHRGRAEENLVASGCSPHRARFLTRRIFEHFTAVFVEGLVLKRRLNSQNWSQYVRLENLDLLEEAIRGRGALFVGCHQGSWELGGIVMDLLGVPLTSIVRPFRNPYLNLWLDGARGSTGQKIVLQRGGLRQLVRDIEGGRVGVILADQNAGCDGVFVPFFGRAASCWATPAVIALRTGATILPFYTYREGPYRYVFGVHRDAMPAPAGNREEDIRAICAWYTALFERSIRERPEQWLWGHRRWQGTPQSGFRKS
ncbi:MAG: lysophospholipid acyltransferase family protein [Planctomycetes bacterium]|nr:lysophospholipid acyltransferase family protein [Planctomycetota bacterium]